jgi:hypothetical protein
MRKQARLDCKRVEIISSEASGSAIQAIIGKNHRRQLSAAKVKSDNGTLVSSPEVSRI